ncbi:MAG: hypothetical protein WC528_04450 [Patescibacteria group bacterium]
MKNEIKKEKKSFWRAKPVSMFAHLILIVLTGLSFWPFASFYYHHVTPLGGDFYQTSSYFGYFYRFATWPPMLWKYIWFNGLPAVFDYPWLHMYLGAPLLNFFTSVTANRIYSLATLFLFFVFSYALFNKLSKNKIFAVFLASLLIWSRGIYVNLFGAGAGAFSATMLFTPLVFYLLLKYFDRGQAKWLLMAAVLSGLSVAGHQGMSGLFVFIPSLILLFFNSDPNHKFFSGKKFKDLFLYLLFFLLSGGLALYPYILAFLGSLFGFETMLETATQAWAKKDALPGLFTFTNPAFYFTSGLLIIFILLRKKFREALKKSLGFIILSLYVIIYEVLMYYGKNFFAETLGSDRAFWFFPLALGGILAIFFQKIRAEKNAQVKVSFGFILKGLAIAAVATGFIFAPSIYWVVRNTTGLSVITTPAENLMAHPNEANKEEVMPDWLDTADKNHRLHTAGAMNIWWNALYDLPLTGGYADPEGPKMRAYKYWRDTSMTGEAMEHFKQPEPIAKNYAFFLIDWYAIKYIEYSSGSYAAPSYLYTNPDFVAKEQLMPQTGYHFYQAKDQYYSPIVRPTNAPTVLIISTQESYNTLLRIIAMENINSQSLIPIRYSQYIDDLTKVNLNDFDAVLLYDYHYKKEKNFQKVPQEPWQKLAAYVKTGGKLFIEGGSDVKESDIGNLPDGTLPEVFPVTKTQREDLGSVWQLAIKEPDLLKNINPQKFDALVYQDGPWNLSYAEPAAIKSGAQIVLTQNDKAILVQENLGQGQVLWSGMNLPYHIKSYNNIEEGRLFRVLLNSLVTLAPETPPPFSLERNKSEEIKITSQNFKGILFKETYYGGWRATLSGEKKKPYEAGVGMMYFPLGSDKNATVEVYYRGLFIYWLLFGLMIFSIVFALFSLIFGEKLNAVFKKLFRVEKIKKKTTSWWEKDEQE